MRPDRGEPQRAYQDVGGQENAKLDPDDRQAETKDVRHQGPTRSGERALRSELSVVQMAKIDISCHCPRGNHSMIITLASATEYHVMPILCSSQVTFPCTSKICHIKYLFRSSF